MQSILEILKYVLPSVVTFLTAWFIIRQFIENEQKKRLIEIRMHGMQSITPVRLQAYERVVLLVERISLQSLVLRVNEPNLSASELHARLVNTVRQEYDHNLSQQLYMSAEAWELIRNAKEEVIKVINGCAGRMGDEATSRDLATEILEESIRIKQPMTVKALDFIKKEVRQTLG